MTPASIIDDTITFQDGGDPTDGDNATRRAFLLHRLQYINNYVHNYRAWEWTYTEANVTVTANNSSTDLPADFLEFGNDGSLHDSTGRPWYKRGKGEIQRLRKQSPNRGPACLFAIWDRQIQLPYTVTSALTFTAFYRIRPEILADDDTEMLIPDRYKDSVVLPGLAARAQESKQDSRDSWFGYVREGMAQMCAAENPMQTRGLHWPRSTRAGGW